jgi:pimeloyl-ACP methyl ester carboxylesterase
VVALLGVAVVVAALALGPRPSADTTTVDPQVPTDPAALSAWIARREAGAAKLRPDAAAGIVWARPGAPARTPLSIVYLHGFSATRAETAPLMDSVAARLGANLHYARLTGHGRDGAAMAEATVADWAQDARDALAVGRALGERVVLAGTSTGATLALWAAAEAPERNALATLILISANLGPADPRSEILTWPWGGAMARLINGPEHSFAPANEAQARGWTTRYPTEALLPMMALVKLVRRESLLERIEAPTLSLYSPADQVVDTEAILARGRHIGGSPYRLIEVHGVEDPSGHILAGAIMSPGTLNEVARLIVSFVGEVAGEQAGIEAAG